MGTLNKALENTWTAAEYTKQVVEARAAARALIDREGIRRWAAGYRRLPARKLFVTVLGVGVS